MAEPLSRCIIIVADDDEGDRFLIRKAMEDGGVNSEIQFVEDGQKLLDRLQSSVTMSSDPPPLPCLILLDLNMPRLDGREVLRVIKGDPTLKRIPIVVLTSSKNPADIASCYEHGANSFFTKPLNYSGLVGLMELLKSYWLEAAKLPTAEA
jgi:two-component system response regulator